VYLIKQPLSNPQQILRNFSDYEEMDVDQTRFASRFFLRKPSNEPITPGWVDYLNQIIRTPLKIRTESTSAVWFVFHAQRTFVIPFGYGWMSINPEVIEENFGLNVVLNVVSKDNLKALDAKSYDGIAVTHRSEASTFTNVSGFGLNIDRYLVSAASGSPSDEATFGRLVTGKDQIRTRFPKKVEDLPQMLDRTLELAASTHHLTEHSWASKMRPLRDVRRKQHLFEMLIQKLQAKDFDRSSLVLPESVNNLELYGYRFGSRTKGQLFYTLDWKSYFDSIGGEENFTAEDFQRAIVHVVAGPDETSLFRWKLFPKCVYAEIDEGGWTYFLHEGRWYEVRADFLEQLDKEIGDLFEQNRSLPECNGMNEDEYNKFLYENSKGHYAFMHRRQLTNFQNGEFCDLYGEDKQMLFVKNYAGSGDLGHLFNQGVTSATLLKRKPAYRNDVNIHLPPSHQFTNPLDSIRPEEFEIRYVIIKTGRDKSDQLPLFSRIRLQEASETLKNLGYPIKVEIVPGVAKPPENPPLPKSKRK